MGPFGELNHSVERRGTDGCGIEHHTQGGAVEDLRIGGTLGAPHLDEHVPFSTVAVASVETDDAGTVVHRGVLDHGRFTSTGDIPRAPHLTLERSDGALGQVLDCRQGRARRSVGPQQQLFGFAAGDCELGLRTKLRAAMAEEDGGEEDAERAKRRARHKDREIGRITPNLSEDSGALTPLRSVPARRPGPRCPVAAPAPGWGIVPSLPRLPMSSRPWLILPVLVLAACPPEDTAPPPAFPGLVPQAAAPEASAAKTAPPVLTAPTTVPGVAPIVEQVRVCIILSNAGPATDVAAEMRRGMTLAREEVDKRPGRTRKIEWVEKDDKSTEPGAVQAFQDCFAEGVPLIIGPVHPAATTALVPVAAAHDAMLLIPEIGAAVPTSWGDNLFAIAPPAADMGRVAAQNATKERGLLEGAVLHVPGIFGESLRDSFLEGVAEASGKVVLQQELPMDSPTAWTNAARDAVAKGAKAIFAVGPGEVGQAVAQELSTLAFKDVHLYLIDWAMHPPVLNAAGDAKSRIHWVNRPVPRGPFAEAYTQRYQARPEYPAGCGYDAIHLAARVIDQAASTWYEELAKVARQQKGLDGAFGVGSITAIRGVTSLDVAGYRIIDPVQDPASGSWMFGGFQ